MHQLSTFAHYWVNRPLIKKVKYLDAPAWVNHYFAPAQNLLDHLVFGLFWFELGSNFHNEEIDKVKIGCGGGMRQEVNEERKVGRMTLRKKKITEKVGSEREKIKRISYYRHKRREKKVRNER